MVKRSALFSAFPKYGLFVAGTAKKTGGQHGSLSSSLYACNNELFQRAVYYRNRSDEDWLLDRKIAPALAGEVSTRGLSVVVQPYLLEQLKGICAAAKSRGVRVELVVAPYFPGFGLQNLPEFIDAVEKTCGLKVRNDSRLLTDPAMFGDFTHVNRRGSEVWMGVLGRDGVF